MEDAKEEKTNERILLMKIGQKFGSEHMEKS